ncbi:MAG TPA: CopD family protein [Candidatus Binatia bacterium]|nr:CopD family protein [Candidatus Binatia bacterium]
MTFWLLALSYWIHLMATVVWLGGLALMGLVAWPALRQQTLQSNQWLALQKRFMPLVNASLVILLLTGFLQMTNDANYEGFLQVNTIWAQAILIKHIAVGIMIVLGAITQLRILPAMDRLALLAEKRPRLAAEEQAALQQREIRLLQINMVCAVAVLLFTAIATAV